MEKALEKRASGFSTSAGASLTLPTQSHKTHFFRNLDWGVIRNSRQSGFAFALGSHWAYLYEVRLFFCISHFACVNLIVSVEVHKLRRGGSMRDALMSL